MNIVEHQWRFDETRHATFCDACEQRSTVRTEYRSCPGAVVRFNKATTIEECEAYLYRIVAAAYATRDIQGCGHPRSSIQTDGGTTFYCRDCEREAREKVATPPLNARDTPC